MFGIKDIGAFEPIKFHNYQYYKNLTIDHLSESRSGKMLD